MYLTKDLAINLDNVLYFEMSDDEKGVWAHFVDGKAKWLEFGDAASSWGFMTDVCRSVPKDSP